MFTEERVVSAATKDLETIRRNSYATREEKDLPTYKATFRSLEELLAACTAAVPGLMPRVKEVTRSAAASLHREADKARERRLANYWSKFADWEAANLRENAVEIVEKRTYTGEDMSERSRRRLDRIEALSEMTELRDARWEARKGVPKDPPADPRPSDKEEAAAHAALLERLLAVVA